MHSTLQEDHRLEELITQNKHLKRELESTRAALATLHERHSKLRELVDALDRETQTLDLTGTVMVMSI